MPCQVLGREIKVNQGKKRRKGVSADVTANINLVCYGYKMNQEEWKGTHRCIVYYIQIDLQFLRYCKLARGGPPATIVAIDEESRNVTNFIS
ncbi:hypothetical protein G4228_010558 [Cervus hanglu yarkandensis]|nr:hypothetical protein G4228_010558 [Cervus hanglu yarkandensis]